MWLHNFGVCGVACVRAWIEFRSRWMFVSGDDANGDGLVVEGRVRVC